MVGCYLGSLGEMDIPTSGGFQIVDAGSGAVVHSGILTRRADTGWTEEELLGFRDRGWTAVTLGQTILRAETAAIAALALASAFLA